MVGAMSQSLYKLPEDCIVNQGDNTSALYFISSGKCRASFTNFEGRKQNISTLKVGSIFGEISYLLKCQRTATVKSLDYVSILYLPRIEGV